MNDGNDYFEREIKRLTTEQKKKDVLFASKERERERERRREKRESLQLKLEIKRKDSIIRSLEVKNVLLTKHVERIKEELESCQEKIHMLNESLNESMDN